MRLQNLVNHRVKVHLPLVNCRVHLVLRAYLAYLVHRLHLLAQLRFALNPCLADHVHRNAFLIIHQRVHNHLKKNPSCPTSSARHRLLFISRINYIYY